MGKKDITTADLLALVQHLKAENFSGREVICREHKEADRMIFIKSGFCKTVRSFPNSAEFNRHRPFYFPGKDAPRKLPLSARNHRPQPKERRRRSKDDGTKYDISIGLTAVVDSVIGAVGGSQQDTGALNSEKTDKNGTFQGLGGPPRGLASSGVGTDGGHKGEPVENRKERLEDIMTPNMVVVGSLGSGSMYGLLDILSSDTETEPSGTYKNSLVADPVCQCYSLKRIALLRYCAKGIVHAFFCHYKSTLTACQNVYRSRGSGKRSSVI